MSPARIENKELTVIDCERVSLELDGRKDMNIIPNINGIGLKLYSPEGVEIGKFDFVIFRGNTFAAGEQDSEIGIGQTAAVVDNEGGVRILTPTENGFSIRSMNNMNDTKFIHPGRKLVTIAGVTITGTLSS